MYHYVRNIPKQYPHFRYLHVNDFIKQLDYFNNDEGFVPKDHFLKAIDGEKVPKKGYLLTFDDGFSDHYKMVFPELLRRGLWGMFYIPTLPYETGQMLDVHRIHHLIGMHGGQFLMEAAESFVTLDKFIDSKVEEFQEKTYKTQKNDDATLLFKRMLNYYITAETREIVLDELMRKFSPIHEEDLLWQYYSTPKQIKAMSKAGMVIGSHSVTHPVMSELSNESQKYEIQKSFNTLEGLLGPLPVRSFCYPHGGFHTFTSDTEQLLIDFNCRFSFNVEARKISSNDVRKHAQALPRFNCNMYPHGTARN